MTDRRSKPRRCSECRRRLIDRVSIRRGVGPVCWRKVQRSRQLNLFERTRR